MRTLDRLGSPPNPQNLTPLSILQNLEVEALMGATLTLIVLRCGRNWCRGGTLGRLASCTRGWLAIAFGRTALVSLDYLYPGLQ
jgi:hypothetical protein